MPLYIHIFVTYTDYIFICILFLSYNSPVLVVENGNTFVLYYCLVFYYLIHLYFIIVLYFTIVWVLYCKMNNAKLWVLSPMKKWRNKMEVTNT